MVPTAVEIQLKNFRLCEYVDTRAERLHGLLHLSGMSAAVCTYGEFGSGESHAAAVLPRGGSSSAELLQSSGSEGS